MIGNKFCLDNIVLVIDYNNLKHIYKHFYGERTDFNGYISKFLSSVPFPYSLEKQKYDYIVDKLVDITNLNVATIKYLFPKSILLSKTMREIVQSFDISNSILGKPNIKIKGRKVNLNTSFLKVMVILRRLKYTDDEIKQTILSLKDKKQDLFVNYVLPFAFLSNKNLGDNELLLNMSNEKNQARTIKLTLDENTGKATVSEYYMRMDNEV